MKSETTVLVIFVILAIALGIAGPLITIWSLNTLFMAGSIAYSFKTWLATLLLQMTIAGLVKSGVTK